MSSESLPVESLTTQVRKKGISLSSLRGYHAKLCDERHDDEFNN